MEIQSEMMMTFDEPGMELFATLPFITTRQTTSNGESITIPLYFGEQYTFDVDR